MTLEELKKLCNEAPNDGDEQDWLDAWREVGPKLIAVAEAAKADVQRRDEFDAASWVHPSIREALAALEAE